MFTPILQKGFARITRRARSSLPEMRAEESEHRRALTELFRERFGDHIPLVRRQDVQRLRPRARRSGCTSPLRVDAARAQVEAMELETRRFYEAAAAARHRRAHPVAPERSRPRRSAGIPRPPTTLDAALRTADVQQSEERDHAHRLFVLQIVQPALAGLMDGSVSTLAPLFAAAFATRDSWDAFLVGIAASVGAGISMGFAEALSDDGSMTGRGQPALRGTICGVMTAVGGLGHTLPYLIPSFTIATIVAVVVVAVELMIISWIRYRYMDTPFLQATFQVVVGGVLVFLSGILIGSA